MSQHHFIIRYDTATNEWEWDTDTEEARFKGAIYLPDEDRWVSSSESTEIYDMDNDLSEKVGKMLLILNEEKN